MSAWITSIVGVICLGILLEIVLPEGKTSKYIRGAFSIVVVLVIVAPLPALVKKDWKFEFDGSYFAVDEEYVNSVNSSYRESVVGDLKAYLLRCGYEVDDIEIRYDENEKLEKVLLSVKRSEEWSDKVQSKKIVELVSSRLKITEDRIELSLIQ